jgi:hypothetical protein
MSRKRAGVEEAEGGGRGVPLPIALSLLRTLTAKNRPHLPQGDLPTKPTTMHTTRHFLVHILVDTFDHVRTASGEVPGDLATSERPA